ncbi:hypothetical protein [Actinomyces lilanjuaniae]|uniref:hypothetical protein n=1 Tax=Actinomyces lilanjuaniae TaxID=2321394 RepID=UPI0013C3F378|nr:hypothetical protein [Actinomyces lilanjuaniae]
MSSAVPAGQRGQPPSPVEAPVLMEEEAEGFTAVQHAPASSPYQDGHYPGAPVYPGVFLIETAFRAACLYLESRGGGRLCLAEVSRARFSAPGFPGDSFTVQAGTRQLSASCWEVRAQCLRSRDGQRLADLVLRLRRAEAADEEDGESATAASGTAAGTGTGRTRTTAEVPVGREAAGDWDTHSLIPHRGEMLLLSEVLGIEAGRTVRATHRVSTDEPCFRGACLTDTPCPAPWPRTLMTEFIGQAAVLLCSYSSGRGADGPPPLFTRARGVRFLGDAFPGDTVTAEVEADHIGSPAALLRARAWVGDRLVCEIDQAMIVYSDIGG